MSHGTHSRMSHATHSRTEHVEGAHVAVTGIIAQRHGLEFANDKRVESHSRISHITHSLTTRETHSRTEYAGDAHFATITIARRHQL